jgi:hypothetical protein
MGHLNRERYATTFATPCAYAIISHSRDFDIKPFLAADLDAPIRCLSVILLGLQFAAVEAHSARYCQAEQRESQCVFRIDSRR